MAVTVKELYDVQRELAARAEKKLSLFCQRAWRIIEPGTELQWNWHHDLLCEHLEAVTAGELRDLLITVPPRHTKSRIVSVFWPAWVWVRSPAYQWLCSSYSFPLAVRDSQYCRSVILSNWYQWHWSERYLLCEDQNTKTKYQTNKGGHRIATTVGGSTTGEGGDTLIVDDPHNLQDIFSGLKREATLRWWDQVLSTRRNDPKKSSRVVIMQRGHADDLAAHILQRGEFEHIELPAEETEARTITYPRSGQVLQRKPGDLLWPGRFGREELDRIKIELGTWAYEAQYQQRPAPVSGNIIKPEWWRYYDPDQAPKMSRIMLSLDSAFKTNQAADWSVCITIGDHKGDYYLMDLWRMRVEYPELKRSMQSIYLQAGASGALIEDAASGQSLAQDLRRDSRMNIIPVKVDRDKVSRVNAITACIEAGRVYLPTGAPWLAKFIEECAQFPAGKFDDQVDALSQVIAYFLGISKSSHAIPNIRML